jgi:hypothetical protein
MMKRAKGFTLPKIMEATGWQRHLHFGAGPRPPFPNKGHRGKNPVTWPCKLFPKEIPMYRLSAALTLAALLTIRALAQTPAPTAADRSPIKVEGAETGTFGAFEASVLAGLDRQVDAQKNPWPRYAPNITTTIPTCRRQS